MFAAVFDMASRRLMSEGPGYNRSKDGCEENNLDKWNIPILKKPYKGILPNPPRPRGAHKVFIVQTH
ncbi:hypothetical protein BgiMline_036394 [Biomphalaria glabrata]